jgi:hypothetical protein
VPPNCIVPNVVREIGVPLGVVKFVMGQT